MKKSLNLTMMKSVSDKKIIYRKASPDDVPEIQTFVDKAKVVMEKQNIPQWDEIYPTSNDFLCDAERNELFIGEIEGKAAVCFTLNKLQDEAYFSADWENKSDDFIVVHRLCVNPDFQGQGVGFQTCKYIESIAQNNGASSIRLDAFTENPISLSMYEKLGYKVRGYADWRKGKFKLLEKKI